ncbi:uncharacterized protein LOC122643697 [Telopea speciosissima]|uniref:uncharacterized protein LOC122643697 n=1 Tax=Telopea speciosissima TaxID=54955 RepID=UPI001CC5B897|nr:uncharacterized protein LOC122643697 [Telopea speciosissima]
MKNGYPAKGYSPMSYPLPQTGEYPEDYPISNYKNKTHSRIRCVFFIITTAVVMIAMLCFLLVFIVHPLRPIFHIDTLSVSNFTIIHSKLNADWNLKFRIWNPNSQMEISFHKINAYIYHKSNKLSNSSIEPVLLVKRNETILADKLETRQEFADKEMEEEWKSTGVLDLSVRTKMTLRLQYKNGLGGYTNDRNMVVLCENLKIFFDDNNRNGRSVGPSDCMFSGV